MSDLEDLQFHIFLDDVKNDVTNDVISESQKSSMIEFYLKYKFYQTIAIDDITDVYLGDKEEDQLLKFFVIGWLVTNLGSLPI